MSNKKELSEFVAMLKDLRSSVAKLKDKGMSLEEVLAEKPSAKYDEENGKNFIKPDQIVTFIYQTLWFGDHVGVGVYFWMLSTGLLKAKSRSPKGTSYGRLN